jgi:hypothetical protein
MVFCALYPKHVLMEVIEWQVGHYFSQNFGISFATEKKRWKADGLHFIKGTLSDEGNYQATFDRAIFIPKISFNEGIFGGKLEIQTADVKRFTYEPLPVIRRKHNPWFSIDLDVSIAQAQISSGGHHPLTLQLQQKIKGKSFEGNLSLQWNPQEPDMRATFSYDAELDQHMIATQFSGHTIQDFYETFSTLFPKHIPSPLSKWRAKGGALYGSLQATFSEGKLKRVVTDLDLEAFEGENLAFQIQVAAKRLGVHLNLDCSSVDKILDWHGKFDVEEGNLAFHPLKDPEWDTLWEFQDIHSSINISDGKVCASQLSGKLMGMEGVLSVCPTKEEILSLDFNGLGEEIAPYLPPSLSQKFAELFCQDRFQLKAHCTQKEEGLSLEGALEHYELLIPQSLNFGCLFREDPQNVVELSCPTEEGFSDQIKRFAGELQQQFHVSQNRLGWFKASSFKIEKYLSPFLLDSVPYSVEGETAIEGSFDENHLVAFYSGENLIFKGRDFSLALHQMESNPETKILAVHCFDLKTKEHSGFLPIENATYDYHKKGIVFSNCKATAYFRNNTIHFKGMEAAYEDLLFKGESVFTLNSEKGMESDYHFKEVKGSYASACKLYEQTYSKSLPFKELTGRVATIRSGMRLRYLFEEKSARLVESSLEGSFDLAGERYGAKLRNFKGEFSTCFPDTVFTIHKASGDVVALDQSYQLECSNVEWGAKKKGECLLIKEGAPVLTLSCSIEEENVNLLGEWRGSPLGLVGTKSSDGNIEATAHCGFWEGVISLEKGEKWELNQCTFEHPDLGSIDLVAEVDPTISSVDGEIRSFSLDIGKVFQKQHAIWDTQGEVAGYGHFTLRDTLEAKVTLSHKDLAISGLKFSDGEYLECLFSGNRGITVNGLKALVPLKGFEESYQLGQLIYDPFRERIFFDRFTFALPTYRTNWLEAVSEQLLDQPPDHSFFLFLENLKKDKTLRGSISAEITKESGRFYLNLEDGEYTILGRSYSLKNTRLCLSQEGCFLESEYCGLDVPVWLEVFGDEKLSSGVLNLKESMQKKSSGLSLNWKRDYEGALLIENIKGALFGIQSDLVLRELQQGKARYQGKVSFFAEDFSLNFPERIPVLAKLNPVGCFSVDGEWTFDTKKGIDHFSGVLAGRECSILGTRFDTVCAYIEGGMDQILLEGVQLEDWCGDLMIPTLMLEKREDKWRFNADKVLVTNFRLSRLNSPVINPKRTRPLCRSVYIPRFELNHFQGNLTDPSTYQGDGVLLFTNYTRKNILTNFLLVPAEIAARIGLDPTNFIPARGRIHYSLDNGGFVLHDFEDVYSEGKRSRFYLEDNTTGRIDFNGNLNVKIKMKQYNLLMKLAELLTISVKGTLFDPVYVFESYPES